MELRDLPICVEPPPAGCPTFPGIVQVHCETGDDNRGGRPPEEPTIATD